MQPQRTSFVVRFAVGAFFLAILGVLLWYVYPQYQKKQLDTATIVYSAPLALQSTDISLQSIMLALEEHNYKAGDITLILTVLDDGDETGAWLPEKEKQNAEAAVTNPSTIAYLGPLNSGAAKISMPILNAAGIVQISPSATWPGLTKTGFLPGEPGIFYPSGIRHFVRVSTTDDLQGPAGAEWAHSLGFKKVFVVDDNDPYGVGIANLFASKAKDIGMNVVSRATITPQPRVYEQVARDIIAANVDLVYYGGLTPNGGPELLKYLRENGSKTKFMGPDGIFEQDFIDKAGSAGEGVFVTAIGAPPEKSKNPKAKEFLLKYRAKYNSDPDVFGALAYDATLALISAIERAGVVDRKAILKEMVETYYYSGIFGTWSFDSEGDTTLTLLSGSIVKNGTFEYSKIISAE